MKFKIELVVDVPVTNDGEMDHETFVESWKENVLEFTLRHLISHHLEGAIHWAVEARLGTPEEDSTPMLHTNKVLAENYHLWSEILRDAAYTIEHIPE